MEDQDKARNSLLAIVNHITSEHPDLLRVILERQRQAVSELVRNHHGNTVAYGPFKGLRLSSDTFWGPGDHGAMVLGFYEQEVLNAIGWLSPRRRIFVDLGAADGYYAIGTLVGGLCEKAYCFEMSEKGRELIARNAELNGVRDRLVILGEATPGFYKEIPQGDLRDSFALVDIEGAEFDLLTADTFDAFAKSVLIVEIHERVEDAARKLEQLVQRSARTHAVKPLTTSSRDLSRFDELKSLNDTDRWLLCSEGRPYRMSWLRFDPR